MLDLGNSECLDMDKKDANFSIRLPRAVRDELDVLAEIEGRSVGDVVRRAVIAHYGIAHRLARAEGAAA